MCPNTGIRPYLMECSHPTLRLSDSNRAAAHNFQDLLQYTRDAKMDPITFKASIIQFRNQGSDCIADECHRHDFWTAWQLLIESCRVSGFADGEPVFRYPPPSPTVLSPFLLVPSHQSKLFSALKAEQAEQGRSGKLQTARLAQAAGSPCFIPCLPSPFICRSTRYSMQSWHQPVPSQGLGQ